jgi:hypothetical protein
MVWTQQNVDFYGREAVHTWYERRFGFPVPPVSSAAEGVATWPETATAVAVHLYPDDELEVTAPWGLRDLLTGVCRRTRSASRSRSTGAVSKPNR